MEKFTKFISSNYIVQAVLSIVLGLLLAVWPEITTITVVYILAACIAIWGIATLITYVRQRRQIDSTEGGLAFGIFLLIIALVVFIFPEAVAGFFSVILGALLVLSGLVNAVRSATLKKYGGNSWIGTLIISLLIAAGGIVIIVNPFETAVTFVLVLGILLVIKGVIDLVINLMLSKKAKA